MEGESEAGCCSDGHYCPRERALVDTAKNRTPGPRIPSPPIFATPSFNSGTRASAGGWTLRLRRDLPRPANSASCTFQRRFRRGRLGPRLRRRAKPDDWRLGDRVKSGGCLGNRCLVDARQRKTGWLYAGLCTCRANHHSTPPQDQVSVQSRFVRADLSNIRESLRGDRVFELAVQRAIRPHRCGKAATRENLCGETSAPRQCQICKCTV